MLNIDTPRMQGPEVHRRLRERPGPTASRLRPPCCTFTSCRNPCRTRSESSSRRLKRTAPPEDLEIFGRMISGTWPVASDESCQYVRTCVDIPLSQILFATSHSGRATTRKIGRGSCSESTANLTYGMSCRGAHLPLTLTLARFVIGAGYASIAWWMLLRLPSQRYAACDQTDCSRAHFLSRF